MRGLLRRLALAVLDSLAEPDPWEPRIRPGQYLVRERAIGDVLPVGAPLLKL